MHKPWQVRRAHRWGLLPAAALCAGGTLALLFGVLLRCGGSTETAVPSGCGNTRQEFEMLLSQRMEEALEGIAHVKKHYWIAEDRLIAPMPDAERFGSTEDQETLRAVVRAAQPQLDGQALYFQPETELFPNTQVQYYRDDTIFSIVWKQLIDGCCYTFAEVKIEDPSQLRRFLAGGAFGSDKLYVTTQMAQTVNAVVASSGDFYAYRRAGVLVYGGRVQRVDNGLVDTCYIDRQGDLHFSRVQDRMTAEQAQQFVDEQDIRFSLAFGPVLIQDGQRIRTQTYAVGEIGDHFPRSALCQLGKLHYLLVTANHEGEYRAVPNLSQFADRIAQTGCRQAYTLDGGQTAVIAMHGEMVNSVMFGYQRKISDILYFATAIPDGGE